MQLCSPEGYPQPLNLTSAKRPRSLDGLRVGLLDNSKAPVDKMMAHLDARLRERVPGVRPFYISKKVMSEAAERRLPLEAKGLYLTAVSLHGGSMASESTQSLITPALRASLHVWSEPEISHPVDCSDIRKWAIAIYWPEVPPKIFWDAEYAKSTRWGGIIAPREFNPFAWPAIRPADRAPKPSKRLPGERTMNGGQKEVYGVPIRPGDIITSTSALVHVEEKVGKLGLTLYKSTEIRWTNQKEELVRSRISIGIVY